MAGVIRSKVDAQEMGIYNMDNQFKEWITKGMKEISVDLSDRQLEQFFLYYKILIDWNQVMNLTTITDMKQVVYKHFVDSVSLIKVIDVSRETFLIDVGSGAGFPGIPLKIVFPELKVTLLDSLNKRVQFLKKVIDEIDLEETIAIHGRAEDIGRESAHREKFDLCVSRAVANLATLSEYCMPFVKVGGSFISYKSGIIEDELKQAEVAIKKLSGSIKNIVNFRIEEIDAERSLIQIVKENKISSKYPRKAGLPGKEPLGVEKKKISI